MLFNYCPTELLDNSYRRQLVLEEILRYQVSRSLRELNRLRSGIQGSLGEMCTSVIQGSPGEMCTSEMQGSPGATESGAEREKRRGKQQEEQSKQWSKTREPRRKARAV